MVAALPIWPGHAVSILPVTRGAPPGEYLADRPQDAVQAKLAAVQTTLDNRGPPPVTVGPITFTAGQSVTINHKLQRQPVEWCAIDVVTGYGSFRRTAWDRLSVTIQSQNACTAYFRIA